MRYQIAALVLLAFVFGTNVYRAATQSITCDEAYMFRLYVDPPLSNMWQGYDAANHVLYTLLARWSVRWFGLSELSLRLPSLLGGLAYLLGVFQLSRYAFGRKSVFLLAVAMLSLNPFLLDYLSVARGYGLALALFVWGFYLGVRYAAEDYDRPVWLLPWAGVLFGLSLAANLVFLLPVLAVGAALTLLAGRSAMDRFWGPGLVPAFVFMVLPLARAERGNFYYGGESLFGSAVSLVTVSLFHSSPAFVRVSNAEWGWRMLVASKIVPALLALMLAAALWALWKRRHWALVLAAAGLGGSLVLVSAAGRIAAVPYPLGRTGIYLAFLFTVGCIGLIPRLPRLAQFLLAGLLLVALWRFAACYTTSYYNEWRYDSASKRVAAELASRGRTLRIAASPHLHHSLRFYSRAWRLGWTLVPTDASADAYVLMDEDRALAQKLGLWTVQDYNMANVLLAVR